METVMALTLTQIASDDKALGKLVQGTLTSYHKMGTKLHETACALFYHAAQGNDLTQLNKFYFGLRVNDQTALRVWFGQHASFIDLDNGTTRNWIKFSKEKGFSLIKGVESHRKDLFTLEDEENKTNLLSLKPFFEKNVKDKDALTLEALLVMLGKAAERVVNQSTKEGISLPADVLTLTTSIKNTTTKELEALERVKE
jgi:hypothetical protein